MTDVLTSVLPYGIMITESSGDVSLPKQQNIGKKQAHMGQDLVCACFVMLLFGKILLDSYEICCFRLFNK